MGKRIILVGGGHAHLFVITKAEEFRSAGTELSLIDPGMLWYSGMATGMLGGFYSKEQDTIDLQALCARNGVDFQQSKATSVDREAGTVATDAGQTFSYDLLSLDVGSSVDMSKVSDPDGVAWTVKPIPTLLDLKARLEERGECRVGVIGGGPTGSEIAANIQQLCGRTGAKISVTLLHGGNRLLTGFPEGAANKLAGIFHKRGIDVRLNTRVSELNKAGETVKARTSDGEEMVFDEVVVATGLVPSPSVGILGWGEKGLAVDRNLAALDDKAVFGAGDCITFTERELPKVGVFGVRAAPVLKDNLLASIKGQSLRPYEPQDKFLIILNLGDGTGLAIRGNWYAHGKPAFIAKNFIDTRFMKKYQS